MSQNKIYKKKIIYSFLITISILFIIFSLQTSFAADQIVDQTLISDGATIQNNISSAIANATNGSTITINPGIYQGSGNNTNIHINKNLTIQGNTSSGNITINGQGSYRIFIIDDNINVTFINITFTNGTSNYGGGIYNNYRNVVMNFIDCTFTNNLASAGQYAYGGAIYNNGGNLTINNCTFFNNRETAIYGYSGGSGVYNVGGIVEIYDSNFINNYAIAAGSAIYNINNGNMHIFNSNFTDNSAGFQGGAIFNVNATMYVYDSTFKNNSCFYGSDNAGGAVCNYQDSYMLIKSSYFINNTAAVGGAVIEEHRSEMIIEDSYFANNTAKLGGGIFNNENCYMNISRCNFDNNNGTDSAGAILNNKGSINIDNSTFTNNLASNDGGAILNSGGHVDVVDSIFIKNQGNNGGAIANDDSGNTNIDNSSFTNNIASDNGGAIYNRNGSIKIQGSNIINNTKGIYINSSLADAIINYNRIFDNSDYDLENNGGAVNADINWWGLNNPNMGKILGVNLNNYFVMNVTNTTALESKGDVTFSYRFRLNDGGTSNNVLLPYFITNVYTNLTSSAVASFDARFDNTFNVNLKSTGAVLYTFITDEEIQSLRGEVAMGGNNVPAVPDTVNSGNNTDSNNPLTSSVDSDNPSTSDVDSDDIETSNDSIAKAGMKETGIPINIVLGILSILGILFTRKIKM